MSPNSITLLVHALNVIQSPVKYFFSVGLDQALEAPGYDE